MPVRLQRLRGGRYRVSTPSGVKARSTTKRNAVRQARLLRAREHGWTPTRRS